MDDGDDSFVFVTLSPLFSLGPAKGRRQAGFHGLTTYCPLLAHGGVWHGAG
jgi:hypothetical protein